MKRMLIKEMINVFKITVLILLFGNIVTAAGRGATVPFKTFEAEDNEFGGAASKNLDDIITEVSSEKAYVYIHGAGGFVQFTCDEPANRVTLRYSIPKNLNGTISLYLNGNHNMDIPLTWAQCYDSQSTTTRLRRYDEKSVELELKRGDIRRFQKDADDTCNWYGIDLIDLELAPEPLPKPKNYLSIIDFGATPNDTIDDTEAIKRCISAAAGQGKGIWIPPGKFHQNTRISIPENIDMMGAGIWYSNLHNTVVGRSFSDDYGFALVSGSTISGIKFTGISEARKLSTHLFRPVGNHQVLKNLWIQNIGCVYGWSGFSFNVFKDSRVIGIYVDGVHFGDGDSHDNLVENVFFRGIGDDAVAQVSRADKPLCYNNVARFNSVIASYWGRGLANIGGDSLIYTDNYISSIYLAGMMIATVDLGESKSRPVNMFLAERNTFHKCGNEGHNHAGIHFYLKRNPMKDVVIRNNIIENGQTEGIHIDNTQYGDAASGIIFENNISRHNLKGDYRNRSNKVYPVLKNNIGF